ncbi:MAG: DUF4352 domain-containing protein [Eubacterium sp.]|nr:DUF4352 domain-containing protein [Eubacterium sp.]
MSSSNDTDTNEPTTEIEVKTTQQQTEATTYKKPETTTHKIVATTQKKVEKKKDDVRDVEIATVKKNFYTVGETAKQAGISMKFKKAIVSHGDSDGFVRPDKGKEYVICVFKVKNKSDEKISMSWAEFEAYIDNRSIDEDVWGLQCEDAKKYGDFSGEVSPGKTLEGCVVYEVKKGWKKLEMRTDLGFGFFHKKEVIFKVKNK